MIDDTTLQQGIALALDETAYSDLGTLERGKVRDCYIRDGRRAIVVTDRLSAFDRIVATIPFKGQVLNGVSAYWLEQTRAICPNHLISVPDPVASLVHECRPFPVEMVLRGFLTGSSPTSIWTCYARGERRYCGHPLAEGLRQHQRLAAPLITPTSKAPKGEHDELLSADEVIERGLATAEEYAQLSELSLALFARGQALAAERGLILVDTKYEFGRLPDGRICLIDEVHTPDSSRYWYADSYEEALRAGRDPRALDKEYVRRYLSGVGFRGEGPVPPLPDEVRIEAARRYIEIYERMTGQPFVPNLEPPRPRIHAALRAAL
jgi:phosphoribosylaminoimidazole-succinocarboxamide synthase